MIWWSKWSPAGVTFKLNHKKMPATDVSGSEFSRQR